MTGDARYDPARREEFLARFDALETTDALTPAPVETPAGRTPIGAVYDAVTDPSAALLSPLSPRQAEALAMMLDRLALARAPRAAAASSSGLTARTGEGFRLRLTASRADPAQSYVTIEIDEGVGSPTILAVTAEDGTVARTALPPAGDGPWPRTVQIVLETADPVVRALGRPDTTIHLL